MSNSTVPAADTGLPNVNRLHATKSLCDALSEMEGEICTTAELLNAAILLLEPLPRDPAARYEHGAIFAVVSAARDAALKTTEKWKIASDLQLNGTEA